MDVFDRYAPFVQDFIYEHGWESLRGVQVAAADAIFNTARFAIDDYQLNNPDDLREYIAKTLFDRKLKKK